MKNKIYLLIHGPYEGNAYQEIFEHLRRLGKHDREKLSVIAVVYQADREKTMQCLQKIGILDEMRLVFVKDLINPGFYNINRQIHTVQSGLKKITENAFVIKLRNDQWVDFPKLFHIFKKLSWLKEDREMIITTNCYTRKDRLYHPSDMFLCAWKEELEQYYSCPLQPITHVGQMMELVELTQKDRKQWNQKFVCPEILLAKNYLKQKGWHFRYKNSDSYEALRRYFLLLNSWEIGLRWKKKRNPLLGAGSIILPCYFDLAPFQGAPIERARCYTAADFGRRVTRKDNYYLFLTKVLFGFCFYSKDQLIGAGYRVLNSKYIPSFVISLLRRTVLLKIWRKMVSG